MSARGIRRWNRRVAARRARRASTVALAVGAGSLIGASGAEAATFTVTDAGDSGPGTLREAIAAAAASSDSSDKIVFASALSGSTITVATPLEPQLPDPGDSLDITGPGADQLTLSGDDSSSILRVAEPDGALSISGLTFTHGATDPSGGDDGGAIFAVVDSLSLREVAITDSTAQFGGGIMGVARELELDDATITGNTAQTGGGAVLNALETGSVSDSTLSGNLAEGGAGGPPLGGGLFFYSAAGANAITVDNSSFTDNTAGDYTALGGGWGGGLAAASGASISDTTITGNRGGGFYTYFLQDVPTTIARSTISGNDTRFFGAGGATVHGETHISDTTINENSGPAGGIYSHFRASSGTAEDGLYLSDSTVTGNHAISDAISPYRSGFGGGLYLGDISGSVENSTVSGNLADAGGAGIFSYSQPAPLPFTQRRLSSTIVADNLTNGSPNDLTTDTSGASNVDFIVGDSLIETPGSAAITSSPAGSNIFNADPQLGPLADNGGPTMTMKPARTSPAIDAGTANGLATDQRGRARTSGADTDIGAVELDLTPPVTTIDSGPADGSTISTRTAAFTFSADDPSTFECSFGGAAFSACSSPKSYPGLADGTYTFRVRATNDDGTAGTPVERTFIVDATAPTVDITSGPDGSTTETNVSFEFDADELSTFECSFDGAAFSACSSPQAYADLADGPHTFRVRATDGAGNTGPAAERAFTIGVPKCNGAPATIVAEPGVPTTGTAGDDVILGTEGPDEIDALGGDDVVCGLGEHDSLDGGDGDDAVTGNEGDDELRGAEGNDALFGAAGDDALDGGAGDDGLVGSTGADQLRGRDGDDEVRGRQDDDVLRGNAGDDLLGGGGGDDDARGSAGDDEILGAGGNDALRGADGDDEVRGAAGDDALWGGRGVNVLNGGGGENSCSGGPDPGNRLFHCD